MANNNDNVIKSIPDFEGADKKNKFSFTVQPNLYPDGSLALEAKFKFEEDPGITATILTKNKNYVGFDGDIEPNEAFIKMNARNKDVLDALVEKGLVTESEIYIPNENQDRVALNEKLESLGLDPIYNKKDLVDDKYWKVKTTEDVRKLAMLNRATSESRD